jgi:hypothetical protein
VHRPGPAALQRHQLQLWRADVLERVETAALPPLRAQPRRLRRAAVWSTLAYEQPRLGEPAQAAAERALAELARSASANCRGRPAAYNDAAMRVNASRWAAVPR